MYVPSNHHSSWVVALSELLESPDTNSPAGSCPHPNTLGDAGVPTPSGFDAGVTHRSKPRSGEVEEPDVVRLSGCWVTPGDGSVPSGHLRSLATFVMVLGVEMHCFGSFSLEPAGPLFLPNLKLRWVAPPAPEKETTTTPEIHLGEGTFPFDHTDLGDFPEFPFGERFTKLFVDWCRNVRWLNVETSD